MMYVLSGTDQDKARAKAHELIDSLLKKRPDAAFFKVDAENFSEAQFDEYLGGQGLFVNKYIVFCDRLGENKEIRDIFDDKIKAIKESDNIFIVLENSFLAAAKKKIEKYAEKVQEFELAEKKAKNDFNIFSLTNALGSRDKKQLWVLYGQALKQGEAPEAIHGVLFWKIKDMLLKGTRTFSREELQKMSLHFVKIYHEAHRGTLDFEEALEKWVLEL